MKKIAIITSTRAEFGLLMPVIKNLKKFENDKFKVDVIVTGTHLYKEYGYTIDEIIKSGIEPNEFIKIPVDSNTVVDISNNQAVTLIEFTKLFYQKQYNGIVILGDRYEMLSIAIAAGNTQTPIFHLCGGDTTEGATDEWIRHSITKMSYIHFPTNEISYKRVIQLGENPNRVFNYGSTSIDNIIENSNMDKIEALNSLGLSDCKFAICTYHPVTIDNLNIQTMINSFIDALKKFPNINFIITKSNSDKGGAEINEILDEVDKKIDNIYVYSSLGVKRYLSLMKNSEFVIGNSSSGIIETPAFKIPTINIGDRQRGRLQANSIINCETDTDSIVKAIQKAMSDEFRKECLNVKNIYGDGHAAEKIANKIYTIVQNENIDLKKSFYNIEE